jgi:hypothetical protein
MGLTGVKEAMERKWPSPEYLDCWGVHTMSAERRILSLKSFEEIVGSEEMP